MANKELWHTFITLTFRDEIVDIKEANKKFHSWQVSISQKFKEFKYVGVPEFQKNGRVHYHILSNIKFESEFVFPVYDEEGKQLKTYNPKKNKNYLVWNVKYWKHGFSIVVNLNAMDYHFNIASYMAKYLFKDFDNRLYSHQKVLVSKGLKSYDVIYSYENASSTLELELGMLEKGFFKYIEKHTEIETDNKHVPKYMDIMKFQKREIKDDEIELYYDYIDQMGIEVEELKKLGATA